MRNYTKIEAWRLADDLTVAVYEKTRVLPPEERYGLTGQLRRAASSVPTNIVEGSARGSQKEYLHFLHIARASLAEAQYLVHLAKRLGYFAVQDATELQVQIKRTFACLHGLMQAVTREAGLASPPVRGPVVP